MTEYYIVLHIQFGLSLNLHGFPVRLSVRLEIQEYDHRISNLKVDEIYKTLVFYQLAFHKIHKYQIQPSDLKQQLVHPAE